MDISHEIRLTVALIAGGIAVAGMVMRTKEKTEEMNAEIGWTFGAVACFVFFFLEIILKVLLVLGFVVLSILLIPVAIRIIGSVFCKSREEINAVRRNTTGRAGLPPPRRDIERLIDEDGNVPEEAIRELIEYYGEHRNGRR